MPQQISNIFSLEELLAIPIRAVIDANAHAAETALDFIIRYGFNPGLPELPDNNRFLGSLRMAQFVYNYVDEKGIQSTMEISIPFLSLIPIPMLEVKKAHFDYAIQILSQDYADDRRSILAIMAPADSSPRDNQGATIGNSLKANMSVSIEVEKSDLPAGLLQLLNLGQEATRGRSEQPPLITSSHDELGFHPGESQTFTVRIERENPDGVLEPIGNADVMIEITNHFKKPAELFAGPIQVQLGTVIGKPNAKIAVAKTIAAGPDKGLVKFQLTRRLLSTIDTNDVNGFIVIRTKRAGDRLVYFKFNP